MPVIGLVAKGALASLVVISVGLGVARANEPPNALSLVGQTIAENEPPMTLIGTFTTIDPDANETFTYVLIDNPLDAFAIVGDQLFAAVPLDYEAGAQRTVRVRTTDAGDLYFEKSFTITMLDRNDAPTGVALSASGVAEDTAIFGQVGSVSQLGDEDQDEAWTFALIDDDGGRFVLEGTLLRTAVELDHETDPDALVAIEVVDRAGLSATSVIPLAIWDRNEKPQGVVISGGPVAEDAGLGAIVGTLAAIGDPDAGEAHTFQITNADGPFLVDGATVRLSGALDFETRAVYTPTVRATDRGGLWVEVAVPIFVGNVNEAPTAVTWSGGAIAENAAPGAVIGTLSAQDQDLGDTHAFTLLAGSGVAVAANGQVTTTASFDFETTPAIDVRVRATDAGGLAREMNLSIPVANVNEAPTAIALSGQSIAESAAPGALVAFVSVSDPDAGDQHELVLLQDGDGALRLEGNVLRVAGDLDFERAPVIAIAIRARDAGGLVIDVPFEIAVGDVDEPASGLSVEPSSVAENQPAGTVVGVLTPIGDPDSAVGYTWTLTQNPGSLFAVQGQRLVTTKAIDFETTRSVQLRIKATPPSGTPIEQQVTIDISDEPEAPTGIGISGTVVQEARNEGGFVATLTAIGDPDAGEQHVFSLRANPDDAFILQGNTLMTAKVLDFETRAEFPLLIRATDRSGLWVESEVEIRVLDVNEAPQGVSLSRRELPENAGPNALVGQLGALGDPDLVDSYTFTLVQSSNDDFEIVGDTLVARRSFDFEADEPSHRVTVRVRDQGGLTAEASFLILIVDANEPPSPIGSSADVVAENAPAGTVVGEIVGGEDPDDGDLGTLAVTADSLADAFAIDAERRLITRRPLDHEASPEATVTVRLTDRGGLWQEASFVIAIGDEPEAPTGIALDHTSVSEGAAPGAVIGRLTVTGDPDRDDVHELVITEDLDFKFAIDGDALVLADAVDFEADATHELAITAHDSTGLSVTTRFTITVLDADDPPLVDLVEHALPAIDEDDKNPIPNLVDTILVAVGARDPEGAPVGFEVVAADALDGRWQVRREGAADWASLVSGDALVRQDLLRFLPAQDFFGEVALVVAPSDGVGLGEEVRITLAVEAVNDPPRHDLPALEVEAWQQSPLDVAAALGGPIDLIDVDAETLELSLAVNDGTLTLPTGGLTVVSGRAGSDAIALRGEIGALEAALTGLVFTPRQGFIGRTEIVITSDDRGQSGAGGARVTTDALGVTVRAAPDLVVTLDGDPLVAGATLDLGTLGEGAFLTFDLHLENRGDEPLLLDAPLVTITPESGVDAWVVVPPAAEIAPADASVAVLMLRAPTVGPVRLALAIASNDPADAAFSATLTARAAAAPDLELSDGARPVYSGLPHLLADMLPGTTTRLELDLFNAGGARLDLGEITTLAATNATVDLETPFPLVDPNDADVLVVYLTPALPGPLDARIALASSDPERPAFEIHLRGAAVQTPVPRPVVTRLPGIHLAAGAEDPIGYARIGQDVTLALSLVNLGARALERPTLAIASEDNCVARVAAAPPERLAPGASLAFSLIARPDLAGPFSVDLTLGDDATWTFTGEALPTSQPVPADALRLYRWGGQRVLTQDHLGPVAPLAPLTAGWSLANDGPDTVELTRPVTIPSRDNVDARPLAQPAPLLPPHHAELVPVDLVALAPGALAFDLAAADHATVRVASEGQVGALGLTDADGAALSPGAILTLPLQKVGGDVLVELYAGNVGTGPLELGDPTLEGGSHCLGVRPLDARLLDPGDRAPLRIELRPVAGVFQCELAVPSDDPTRDAYVITLVARGTRAADGGCATSSAPAPFVALALLTLTLTLSRARRRTS